MRGILRRPRLDVSADPLTGLPGGPSLEAEVERRMAGKLPFAFLLAGLEPFKPYNDFYGFARGDEVLEATAQLLRESLRSAEAKDAFLGSAGGGGFAAVVEPESAALVANHAAASFDRKVVSFYNPSELSRGAIETADRQGRLRRFPLLTLSIGVVTTRGRAFEHYAEVVSLAAEMKAYCRSLAPERLSRFAFDRRRGPGA